MTDCGLCRMLRQGRGAISGDALCGPCAEKAKAKLYAPVGPQRATPKTVNQIQAELKQRAPLVDHPDGPRRVGGS